MIINNWRNGFGNDSHTDLLVHSNEFISAEKQFFDYSSKDREMTIKNFLGQYTNTHHDQDITHLGVSSIKFSLSGNTCSGCTLRSNSGVTLIDYDDFCFDFSVYVQGSEIHTYSDQLYIGYFNYDKIDPFKNGIFLLFGNTTGEIFFRIVENNVVTIELSGSTTYTEDKWYHYAIMRKGYMYYLYVGGVLLNSYDYRDYYDLSFISNPHHMIYYDSGACSNNRKFYVDEWRHSIGSNRWNSDFTVPDRFY